MTSEQERGVFISFEGADGSGKTTQSKILYEHLKKTGHDTVWTRGLGGTDVGEKIRDIMLYHEMSPLTELLLTNASRNEHINKVIIPCLNSGSNIVCDRFVDSSAVYRDITGAIKKEEVYMWHANIFGDIWPDITFLIDIEPEIAMKRIENRVNKDKYDSKDIKGHTKIRETFLEIAKLYPERIRIVDGNKSKDEAQDQVIEYLWELANESSQRANSSK